MTMGNWIELLLLIVIIITGTVIKRHTKKKTNEIDGFKGTVKGSDCEGKVLVKYEK